MSQKEGTQEYIERYKARYKSIKSVYCNALGLRVAFTMPGFKHLIYKGRRRRPITVCKSRLKLISLAPPVLKTANEIVETRVRRENHYGTQCDIRYDALEAFVSKSNIKVRVVVRTIGKKGTSHFFSIMRY